MPNLEIGQITLHIRCRLAKLLVVENVGKVRIGDATFVEVASSIRERVDRL